MHKKKKRIENTEVIKFDFNNPSDARDFLNGLMSDGVELLGITIESIKDGEKKYLAFNKMTDEEAMHYASEIWVDWMDSNSNEKITWKPKFH